MSDELLILVDEEKMDTYKDALHNLRESYIKWGLRSDKTFKSTVFWGSLDLLRDFTEIHITHFDENQALGRVFLFIVKNSLNDKIRREIEDFNCGFWSTYDIPVYLLLIHKNSKKQLSDILVNKGARIICNSSYLFFESLSGINEEVSVYKCYPLGGKTSIDTWKSLFYKTYP